MRLMVYAGFTLATLALSGSAWSAPTVEFSHGAGFLDQPVELRLTTRLADAQIFYTTNGSAPSPQAGTLYSAPLRLESTRVIRAAAFQENARVSEIATRSFLFLRDVVRQTGAGFPSTWGTNAGQPVPADYAMDPEITSHPAYRDRMEPALRALPSMSLVLDPADLFDPTRGLYANPRASGADWERPASLELMFPEGRRGFQIPCGVRIQGGWNRRPEESPKHAFRVVFRKQYGAGKLKFPLFGDAGPREFETLILRAGCNNTWLHWSGEERRRADFLRDQWMRDTLRAMGHPSAAGNFVHLYLNGLYWGLYNLTERPDASFAAAHFGGAPHDYDVRNGENILEGDDVAWQQMFARANAGLASEAAYRAIQEQLDVLAFIDYMLVNLYGANADWDRHSNWYAARRRRPPGPYRFFVWDAERTLENARDDTLAFDDDQSPPRLFHKLRENAEFRKTFAERVRIHCATNGALAPSAAAGRFAKLADAIDLAVIAESARWGDYRRDVHRYKEGPYELYTRDDHWRPEIDRLLRDYFPRRTEAFLLQLEGAGMLPTRSPVPVSDRAP